jgi:hypothetical protein
VHCAQALIPFPDQSEIRREAADSASARQGEATTYRFDLKMEIEMEIEQVLII